MILNCGVGEDSFLRAPWTARRSNQSILKELNPEYSLEGLMHIKKQRCYFANKGPSSQSYGFSSCHVWMRELDYKKRLSAEELMLLNGGVGEDS